MHDIAVFLTAGTRPTSLYRHTTSSSQCVVGRGWPAGGILQAKHEHGTWKQEVVNGTIRGTSMMKLALFIHTTSPPYLAHDWLPCTARVLSVIRSRAE